MTPRTRKYIAQAGSFVLAGLLLYLSLRGVNVSEVGLALREARYVWLLPLMIVTLLSHLLRAWRWQMLLEALPAEQRPGRVSLWEAFAALMIGYMVNYAAPRAGEFVRAAHLARRTRVPFSSVLGTVTVERLLDVLVLGLALVSVAVLLVDQMAIVQTLFIDPIRSRVSPSFGLILAALALLLAGLLLVLTRRIMSPRGGWSRRLQAPFIAFRAGLMTVVRSKRPLALTLATGAMWACYLLMAYLPFVILGMHETFSLSLLDAWSVMILGALGVALPSPGGTGSYHYITIETLVHLYGVARSPAASYAILAHAGQMILYIALGIALLLIQGTGFGELREEARMSSEVPEKGVSTEAGTRI
ncbi:MAG: UPF0104 family protein [Bacteroidetes bacterium]|nr:MAG: UPF0104 family protein [Bacteroidota bacterium]